MNIGIIDSPCGNVFSVESSLEYLGFEYSILKKKNDFLGIQKIILPGVGNFHFLSDFLIEKNLHNCLIKFIQNKGHFLGICLGSQILCKRSEEDSLFSEGLSLINCNVLHLKKKKFNLIPNMGWGNLSWKVDRIFNKEVKFNNFYFCHSYYINSPAKNIVATLGQENIPVIVKYKNAFGVQFHPEKSGKNGLNFIESFLEWKE